MTDEEKLAALAETGRMGEIPEKPADPPAPSPDPAPVVPPVPDPAPAPVVPPEPPKPADPVSPPAPAPNDPVAPVTDPDPDKLPRRYIPVGQYTHEKKEWKDTLAAKDKEIEDLKKVGGGKPADPEAAPAVPTTTADTAIKAFADKYGYEPEDVKNLWSAMTAGSQIPKEVIEELDAMKADKARREEAEYFSQEWQAILPSLKAQYPNASEEQLSQARNRLNELGHTKDFHDKDLDYVLFKSRTDIEAVLAPAAAPAVPAPRKTAESSRPGSGTLSPITASDFKDKQSFEELGQMDEATRNKIVRDMDPKTYARLVTWVSQQENDGGVVVQRDGRRIVLK